MPKIAQHLPVVDSRPGVPLKVNKTHTVEVTVDARGEVRFKLNARPLKRSPSPEAIRNARKAAGLTQKSAAEKCLSALRSWQDWEYGKRRMHPAIWLVFQSAAAPEQTAPGTKRAKPPVRPARTSRAHQSARA
jgi:DNA-binding transcriptional regulator YiaG